MQSDIIAIEGLRKSYGTFEALKGIDFKTSEGKVVSILGPSGSGKSTFLRCLNLLEEPSAGWMRIADIDVTFPLSSGRAVRKMGEKLASRVGMVFQGFNLWSHRTVLENIIEAPIHVQGRPKAEVLAEAESWLNRVGLWAKRHSWPADLSGGQQQRAAIARALALNPKVLLFDEPTSALDPELVGEVLNVMTELAKEGRTMLVVTHEVRFAREVSDRVVFLEAGELVADGEADEMFSSNADPRFKQFVQRAI